VRNQVLALMDADILLAADAGEQDAYDALRALRAAVSQDLTTRGVTLPALVTVTTPQPEPSLALAWRLYQDTRREPGMVARADVIHPLFMPTEFEALSA
jgi:prophage DNA circulation protein